MNERVTLSGAALEEPRFETCRGAVDASPAVSSALPFENVYREHAGFVFRVLRGMGVSDALVEDAVQDVFVVVHRRLSEFDGRHSVKTWLFAIACRVAHDYRRKQKRVRAQEPLDEGLPDGARSPAESAEQNQAVRVLGALLDRMDDDKRAVLVLSEIEGMTAPEIATVTGVRLNTIYTRLRRARLELNAALSAFQKGDR